MRFNMLPCTGRRTAIAASMLNCYAKSWTVNHKRVLRLMRIDNLLCIRPRRFIFITDSRHGLPIYPNLVTGLVVPFGDG